MAKISVEDIKKLREETGAGLLDCKKALEEAGGDFEKAKQIIKEKGLAKAVSKSSREALQGKLEIRNDGKKAIILELNCETDFVAATDEFKTLAKELADYLFEHEEINSPEDLSSEWDEKIKLVAAKVGENVKLSRFSRLKANSETQIITHYLHIGDMMGSIVLFDIPNKDIHNSAEVKDVMEKIAIQVTAMRPVVISPEEVSDEMFKKYEDYYQSKEEMALLSQPFYEDEKMTVGEFLDSIKNNIGEIKIVDFVAYKVGEPSVL